MTNQQASDVLREYIRTNRPCNGLETALQKAITALEHQPEPQLPDMFLNPPKGCEVYDLNSGRTIAKTPTEQQCVNCGRKVDAHKHICQGCGSSDLRPVYMSEIGRKA